ncbi:hypothetical protein [Candidatus Leptofilum sp.]|uniref:hypothetical protein n=1 Tax=Candidatus Leptofilum sp. TaxID=3241576 RepID=UPI003B5A64D7
MKTQSGFNKGFWGLLLLLLFGCTNPVATPTAVFIPTLTADLTPKPTDIVLQYQNELSAGEKWSVTVFNQGNVPYIYYLPEGDRCLHIQIKVAPGRYFPTSPETCDVLVYHVVEPGEEQRLGSWDLNICEDELCGQLSPAPPDEYITSATFYPFFGDLTQINANSDGDIGEGIEKTATFTLTE